MPIRRCSPGFRPFLHLSDVSDWEIQVEARPYIGEIGRGGPFVPMLTETSPFTAQGGHQNRLDAGVDYLSWVWSLRRRHLSRETPRGAGPHQAAVPPGPDARFASGHPSATPEYHLLAHRLQIP
jgi:hypothetical protein